LATVQHEHPVALLELGVAVGVVAGDGADEAEHRRDVADQLVDRDLSTNASSSRLSMRKLLLLGEEAEGEHAAGDGVAGGLVAGHQQHGQEGEQLVVVEPPSSSAIAAEPSSLADALDRP
jgi:hypothetical protein